MFVIPELLPTARWRAGEGKSPKAFGQASLAYGMYHRKRGMENGELDKKKREGGNL